MFHVVCGSAAFSVLPGPCVDLRRRAAGDCTLGRSDRGAAAVQKAAQVSTCTIPASSESLGCMWHLGSTSTAPFVHGIALLH